MSRLVAVSNRVALPRGRNGNQGGLAVGLNAALQDSGGLWFGWSGNTAEAPSDTPRRMTQGGIAFATLDLSEQDYRDYYAGFSNRVIWPLFHQRMNYIRSRSQERDGYRRVNERFARTLAPLLETDDLVWVQDYHLMLLGRALREHGVEQPIGFFLHIPFPPWDVLRALPEHHDLLAALTHCDLLGFQTAIDRDNFLDCLRHAFGTATDGEAVTLGRRRCRTGVFPIGIDVDDVATQALGGRGSHQGLRLENSLGPRRLILSVDRLDYSKGLPERFTAYETLLDAYPEYQGQVIFLQIAPPSRSDIPEYQEIRTRLERDAGHINGRFSDYDWTPLRYLNRAFARGTVLGFLAVAHVGLVTPMRDGMNLVAKEFVAAQDPEDPGVLVLSHLAGAAQELDSAVIVNPYDIDDTAAGLERALSMPPQERVERWQHMMEVLRRNDIHAWRRSFLEALERTRSG